MYGGVITYGNDVLLSPAGTHSLYVPMPSLPDRYLYDPYGVSGVMCNITAVGEGSGIHGDCIASAVPGTSSFISAYMSGEDCIFEHSGRGTRGAYIYLKDAACINRWRGDYWWQDWPQRNEAISSMHLIFSADFMLGYKPYTGGSVSVMMAGATTPFSAFNLSASELAIQPTPVAYVEGSQTAKNGTYRLGGSSPFWYRNVGENPSANWFNITRVMTISSNNQWYHNGTLTIEEPSLQNRLWYNSAMSSISMQGISKIRNPRMIYFASAKAQEVYDNWSACSASYPSGIMPEYIAQKKPII